jgi:tetratricopeptide (TPR) repeat protein
MAPDNSLFCHKEVYEMRLSAIGYPLLIVVIALYCACPSSVLDETQNQRKEHDMQKLEQDRIELLQKINRDNYKTEKEYRKVYQELLEHHKKLALANIDVARYQYLYAQLVVDKNQKIKILARCLDGDANNFWCLVERGQIYADWGVENFALQDLKKAQTLRPDSIEPTLGLATLEFRRRRNQQAIQLYKQALKQQPNHVQALFNLALLYNLEKQSKQAIEHYIQLIKIQPKHFESLAALANLYEQAKQYEQSAAMYERAIELRPLFRLLMSLANLYEVHLNESLKAVVLYERAAEMPQVNFQTYYRLSVLYSQQGDLNRTIDFLKRALRINPEHIDALFSLARAHINQKDYKQSVPILINILRLDNKKAEVRITLADVYVKIGEYADALSQYQDIIEQNPNNTQIRDALKALLTKLGLSMETFTDRTPARVIQKAKSFINRCYQKRLKETSKLRGRFNLSLRLSSDGKVEQVNISSSTIQDAILEACIKWTFRRAIFPIRQRSQLQDILIFP